MDLNNLKDMASNLTLYDLKAGVRKVQNAVMNYTEMESKVREATNNEPWGASSTLMQEIANGTFNYQTLNEIMPMIYRRFTEKAVEEWRQIYKALQLLEFLIKHGSERVIDDARSHITLLKMLRQFHFIDQNGKDQGINVRNRAKELAELLSDVDRIRSERKKARNTRGKYTGLEGGGGLGGGGGGSSRYGGFGSESAYGSGGGGGGGSGSGGDRGYGGYSGGEVYGDGGGFGGQENEFRSAGGGNRDKFDEYDEYDEGAAKPGPAKVKRTEQPAVKQAAPPPKKKELEVDLFSFDDDPVSIPSVSVAAPSSSNSGLGSLAAPTDDDDFDDFQSAPVTASATPLAAPKPVPAANQANLSNMVGMSSISPAPSSTSTPGPNYSSFSIPTSTTSAPAPVTAQAPMSAQAPKVTAYQPTGPNYFQSVQTGLASAAAPKPGPAPPKPSGPAASSTMANLRPTPMAAKAPSGGGDAFGALWSTASGGVKKTGTPTTGPTMGQLAKEKSAAGIWGAPGAKPAGSQAPAASGGSAFDDLLG